MNSGRRTAGSGAGGGEAEVEELLRAAQDDLLLNLSINSHSISSNSSSLDPDLTQRLQSLKFKPNPSIQSISSPNPLPDPSISKGEIASVDRDDEMSKALGEDLAMRFAKLKGGSIGSGSDKAIATESSSVKTDFNGDNDQDEVEKVMQWAMDAARLDPSHSDIDDDHHKLDQEEKIDYSTEEEEEKDEEELASNGKTKNNSKKKWFLF